MKNNQGISNRRYYEGFYTISRLNFFFFYHISHKTFLQNSQNENNVYHLTKMPCKEPYFWTCCSLAFTQLVGEAKSKQLSYTLSSLWYALARASALHWLTLAPRLVIKYLSCTREAISPSKADIFVGFFRTPGSSSRIPFVLNRALARDREASKKGMFGAWHETRDWISATCWLNV